MYVGCAGCFFFCNDTATTEIYTYLHTLSLHDALPILGSVSDYLVRNSPCPILVVREKGMGTEIQGQLPPKQEVASGIRTRSEEHTSELQSLMRISYAVFCLKKKTHSHRELYGHSLPMPSCQNEMNCE